MKLIYFDVYGRAEAMRMLLTHAKVEFEDFRLSYADWPAYKKSDDSPLEFDQVPVLILDSGKVLSQSRAILRYLGMEYGYMPKDAHEAYLVDSILDAFGDMTQGLIASKWETNPERKKQIISDWLINVYPRFLAAFEKRLESQGDSKFLVGNSLTIADFAFTSMIYSMMCNELSEAYGFLNGPFIAHPKLNAYAANMKELFNDYLESRPKRPM
ncbi:glutathione s-pi 1 [Stylonychia lemnae]|uniref:Glutathione s-pi 1 n=1 Tax=Stylonychia lemnae TaxID=5949 RepID=A0A077ZST0_STYLE|nr:glutathione s-pi 1 [Stylonychia lemnae]|eukprot:CDW72614.1 glutathione s-pi 1 [Stylonychia lemnae]